MGLFSGQEKNLRKILLCHILCFNINNFNTLIGIRYAGLCYSPQILTLAVWFITWIRSDKGSTAENREKAFQSRLLSRRATQKEYVIPRGQMEQILHAIHNLREIGQRCSTFTVLLLTFVTQRDRGTHILTQRKTEAGAENLAHHSREIRGWSHPETRGALHYGRAQAAETPSAPRLHKSTS